MSVMDSLLWISNCPYLDGNIKPQYEQYIEGIDEHLVRVYTGWKALLSSPPVF